MRPCFLPPFPLLLAAVVTGVGPACAPSAPPRPTATPCVEGPVVDPSVVDALRRARLGGPLLTPFADARGLELEDAYAVQRALTGVLVEGGDPIVGLKAAFNGEAARARFGLQAPAWAPLFASMQVAPEEAVPVSLPGTVLAEVEVAFTVAEPIEEVPGDARALREHLRSVHVALELPRIRFDAPPTGLDLVADGAAAHRFAIGPALPVDRLGEGPAAASLRLGEGVLADGEAVDPWEGLRTLVAAAVEAEGRVEGGTVLLAGALAGPVPVPVPEGPATLVAAVEGLGEVAVPIR